MRRMFTVLVASFAVVAFSSMSFAQTAAASPKAAKTQQTAKAEKAPKATAATGAIEKFDAATKTLTVKTKKGAENFTLNADTKIMEGSKAATDTDLVAGKHVKVAYTEAAGQMTATKVTLAAEKTAKKTEPKKEEKK